MGMGTGFIWLLIHQGRGDGLARYRKRTEKQEGAPLRTDFGLSSADLVTVNQALVRALEYRRMVRQGLNPRYNAQKGIPTFEEVAQQVHIERLPTWKNAKHGQQWINTLRDYAFPKIGRMPVDSIGEPEVLMCFSLIWTEKHETARRLSQRIKVVLAEHFPPSDVVAEETIMWSDEASEMINGDVPPCPFMENSAGSVKDQSFVKTWHNAPCLRHYAPPNLKGAAGRASFRYYVAVAAPAPWP
ncbi:MAG: phage integrase central domain-containing protein [Alphaproteobacteria bacterium]